MENLDAVLVTSHPGPSFISTRRPISFAAVFSLFISWTSKLDTSTQPPQSLPSTATVSAEHRHSLCRAMLDKENRSANPATQDVGFFEVARLLDRLACQQLLLLVLQLVASSSHFGRFAARDDRFEVVLEQVHVLMVDSDAGTVHERLQIPGRGCSVCSRFDGPQSCRSSLLPCCLLLHLLCCPPNITLHVACACTFIFFRNFVRCYHAGIPN